MYAHTGRPASARKSRRKNHTEQQQRSSNNSTTKKFQQVFQVFAILFFPLKTSTTFFFLSRLTFFPYFDHILTSLFGVFYLASCVYIVIAISHTVHASPCVTEQKQSCVFTWKVDVYTGGMDICVRARQLQSYCFRANTKTMRSTCVYACV